MIQRERTRQQLDPAGTTGVRLFTVAAAVGAFLYATVISLANLHEIVDAPLAVLSFALFATATILVTVTTSPLRAPLTRRSHLLIQGAAVTAYFASAASTFGQNAFVRDDWGPVAIGILLLSLGPYRPAREIAAVTIIAAIFIGFVTLTELPWFVTDGPPLAFVILAISPELAMGFGAVAYSISMVSAIERWQRRAREANLGQIDLARGSIARSVRQDRVTILGRDVLPFFSSILEAGEMTDADRDRAREISDSIRQVMVAEADRTWLQNLVSHSALGESDTEPIVEDRDHLATSMNTEQRTSIRALLVAFVQSPEFEPDTIRIRIGRDGDLCRVVLTTQFAAQDAVSRSAFSPYFALMRAVFDGFDVEFDHSSLRLRFWYE